jgi:hypothetical protein
MSDSIKTKLLLWILGPLVATMVISYWCQSEDSKLYY